MKLKYDKRAAGSRKQSRKHGSERIELEKVRFGGAVLVLLAIACVTLIYLGRNAYGLTGLVGLGLRCTLGGRHRRKR